MKRIISFALALLALMPLGVMAAGLDALPFNDIDNMDIHGAQSIAWAYENGIINGISQTKFAPEEYTSRAMFVTMLYRRFLAQLPQSTQPVYAFTDVSPAAYYYDAVSWAVSNGIVKGTTATTFTPDRIITLEEVTVLMHRTYLLAFEMGEKNYDYWMSMYTEINHDQINNSGVSGYAVEALTFAVAFGTTPERWPDVIDAKSNVTRAEAVASMYHLEEISPREAPFYTVDSSEVAQVHIQLSGKLAEITDSQEIESLVSIINNIEFYDWYAFGLAPGSNYIVTLVYTDGTNEMIFDCYEKSVTIGRVSYSVEEGYFSELIKIYEENAEKG